MSLEDLENQDPIESPIESIWPYDELYWMSYDQKELRVWFGKGTYLIEDVSKAEAAAFLGSENQIEYFNQHFLPTKTIYNSL